MWNFYVSKHTTFGKGALLGIAENIDKFKGKKPLFVLSQRAQSSNSVQRLFEALSDKSISYATSNNIASEAPFELVTDISDDFKKHGCDSIIAIGGGSVIDLAKAASIVVTHGGNIEDYYGLHNVPGPVVPKILVPTTSGAGSEATNIIVLTNKSTKSKKGIVSHHLFADWVVLDPELTYSVPKDITLTTGLDAFCQCLEGYTSKSASPLVDLHALKGMRLIVDNLEGALDGNTDARDAMCFGAYLSGISISGGNSGTNIGHALGNTIGGMFGTAHGLSVSAVLEEGVKFNSVNEAYKNRLQSIKDSINLDVLEFLAHIQEKYGIPRLKDLGVKLTDISSIASRVMTDQQRLLINNRREISQDDLEQILEKSL